MADAGKWHVAEADKWNNYGRDRHAAEGRLLHRQAEIASVGGMPLRQAYSTRLRQAVCGQGRRVIVSCPAYFPPRAKNRLGTRLGG